MPSTEIAPLRSPAQVAIQLKAREVLLYPWTKRSLLKTVTHETNFPKQDLRKRKLFLTLKNNRNNRIRFPKFRFRDIAGRLHNHAKHGSSWAEGKCQPAELTRSVRWGCAPRGEKVRFLQSRAQGWGRGRRLGGSLTDCVLKATCKLIPKLRGAPAVLQAPAYEFGKCGSEKGETSTKNNYVQQMKPKWLELINAARSGDRQDAADF